MRHIMIAIAMLAASLACTWAVASILEIQATIR
jgi:hypothetical protein